MADAPTLEQRRRVVRLTAFEAGTAAPSLLVQVKRLVAEVDALADAPREVLVATLERRWPLLFRGCEADKNRARYSAYRSSRVQLQALHDALDAALNP